jgi:hypothetical protein
MDERSFRKLGLFYLAIQVTIWTKVFAYTLLTGGGATIGYTQFFKLLWAGAAMPLLQQGLANPLIGFDILFHTSAHFLIAACVFVLAKSAKRLELVPLATLFLAAVITHNASYWATGVLDSMGGIYFDFMQDTFLLFAFAYGFRLLLGAVPALKAIRIPPAE